MILILSPLISIAQFRTQYLFWVKTDSVVFEGVNLISFQSVVWRLCWRILVTRMQACHHSLCQPQRSKLSRENLVWAYHKRYHSQFQPFVSLCFVLCVQVQLQQILFTILLSKVYKFIIRWILNSHLFQILGLLKGPIHDPI